ncbi:type IV pilus major pilin [Providencia vermicola]|uniref:type IV pilus major pilin n=1 Tax=Providencia vermicola TaxID=333965 RepID=UPI001CEDDBDE|nr:type IV pilus major pilin [Providencia vermicola]
MFKVYQQTQSLKMELLKKIRKHHEAKKQRGMTLLEIIIVLGIIGTIAAGVVVLAQRAFDSRAVSDVVSNTNTVRVAMKDAYQRSTGYPPSTGAASGYNVDNIKETATSKESIARLVQLGKLSIDEARNSISNDFLNIGGAKTAAAQSETGLKGFVIELNGLNQDQCRNIISQVGNQWDYVAIDSAAAGTYSVTTAVDMSVVPTANILRTLNADGNKNITPDVVAGVCTDSPENSVILGSR